MGDDAAGEPGTVDAPTTSAQRADPADASGRSRHWLRRLIADPGDDRLDSALETYAVEFDAFVEALRAAESTDGSPESSADAPEDRTAVHWSVGHVHRLLGRARTHLEAGRVQRGWNCLHAARRVECYTCERYDRVVGTAGGSSRGESGVLRARAREVHREAAARLSGWRRAAVDDLLLDAEGGLRTELSAVEVIRARHLIDETNEHDHTKRRYLQRQLRALLAVGVLALVTFLWGVLETNPLAVDDVTSPAFVAFVPLLGALGASLFGVRSVWKTATSTKVPQSFTPFGVVLARTFVGSGSAVVLYLALHGEVVSVTGVQTSSASVLLTVAVAAGYSERLAPQAIERVSQLTERGS
jgi:hypothetical protein